MDYREQLLKRYPEYKSAKYYGSNEYRKFMSSLNPIELEIFQMQDEIDALEKENSALTDTVTQLRERNSFITEKLGGVSLAVKSCGIV